MPIWTFEMLAQADRKTLENVLLASQAPDLAHLDGCVYDGYNHEWFGRLPGEKFRKAFCQKSDTLYGFNQVVLQDGQHYRGEWHTKMKGSKPAQLGFYRVTFAKDEPPQKYSAAYRHLAFLNYNIDLNPRWNVPIRSIRDYVGLPNAGDHSVLLGKAYTQVTPWLTIFASYFLLGHPKALEGQADNLT